MPRRIRPKFPEKWRVPNEPKKWITWEHAHRKLAREKVYWISTASRRGQPHAAPVWGIWKKNRFYFETDPKSMKGRNLSSNQSIVVHVPDGNDTVIVEGNARRVKTGGVLSQLRKDYARKYQYTPDWSNKLDQIVFRVQPKTVHAWKAPRMHRSLVKFIF
jgi:nitroimidazol reductase NimA-like FMN-containing flavoprotein (pyridoxamine 5'-phosphate oxidase superfamily)